jgi:hypothetical protein
MTQYDVPLLPQYPPPYQQWAPAPRRRRGRRVVGILAFIVVAALIRLGMSAAAAEWRLSGKDRAPLHTPATVGGYPRMTGAGAQQLEDDVTGDMTARQQPQAGVYGRGGTPQYLLVAGFALEASGAEVLAGLREDMDTARFGKPAKVAGGLTCQTVTDGAVRGAACAWAGKRSNGMVVALHRPDVTALAKVTRAARAKVDAK